MKSTQQKIQQLEGLLGTPSLNERDEGFVRTLQRHRENGTTGQLTDPQIDWMDDLWRRHFA